MKSVVAALLCAIVAMGFFTVPAHADTLEFAGSWGTLSAPTKKKKGAVYGPYAICDGNVDDQPDSYQIVIRQGERLKARSSTGYVELKAGTYRATVSATCHGVTKSVTETLTIKYLRDSQTVSRGEYKKIKKGQSVKKIQKTIGGKLEYLYREDGRTWYTKPNTKITGRVFLAFRKGRLVVKDWSDFTHP